eukprot:CAMPEP_0114695188 /NCGR_PEP_ID=MMETSP0191-20121206/71087_1 /TAXON_ID=126664 /ORGANISM="Sorites sp." /LENGTH=148 /DNA_ID=CAMNT_0001991139 /DNA_START=470 /DNA_END=913 /DNA_ORIENTATION=-
MDSVDDGMINESFSGSTTPNETPKHEYKPLKPIEPHTAQSCPSINPNDLHLITNMSVGNNNDIEINADDDMNTSSNNNINDIKSDPDIQSNNSFTTGASVVNERATLNVNEFVNVNDKMDNDSEVLKIYGYINSNESGDELNKNVAVN